MYEICFINNSYAIVNHQSWLSINSSYSLTVVNEKYKHVLNRHDHHQWLIIKTGPSRSRESFIAS